MFETAEPGEALEGEATPSLGEMIRGWLWGLRGNIMLSLMVVGSLFMSAAYLSLLVWLDAPVPPNPTAYGCAAGGVFLLVGPPVGVFVRSRLLRAEERVTGYRLTTTHLGLAHRDNRSELAWKNLEGWTESATAFFVRVRGLVVVVIPKRAFGTSDGVTRARALLREHSPTRRPGRGCLRHAVVLVFVLLILTFVAIYELVTDRPPAPGLREPVPASDGGREPGGPLDGRDRELPAENP